MEILNTVFTFVSNNILTKAEFFVGLIVLVGYILLGRKWYETLAGFLKAVVGYMILNVGSAGLINTFRPILAGLNQKFHLNAVVIDPYFGLNAVNAALENIGLSAAWTMTSLLLAFIWNIILLIFRKFTKTSYVTVNWTYHGTAGNNRNMDRIFYLSQDFVIYGEL